MGIKNLLITFIALSVIAFTTFTLSQPKTNLPIIAIANYGPHSSLEASIKGMKQYLQEQGYIENKTIKYEIADVSFEPSLIPQMINKLKSNNPRVIVVMTTPIAQFAKANIKNIPLVYNVITDPVEAGLIKDEYTSADNITGSSDKQDMKVLFDFAKKLIPHAKRVGVLYSTAESNDTALIKMMKEAGIKSGMEIIAVPIDQARDVPVRMQKFKNNVDFIYVGTSGPIQPTLPVIAAESKKMGIGVINVDEGAVKDGLILASFGVDYIQVGVNAGKLIAQVLSGVDIKSLKPIYPLPKDHHGFINKKKAKEIGLEIPSGLNDVEIVG